MAVAQRRPDAVIHHSDQGCQYTSLAFGARCQEWDVALSMGSVGDCFDNAMAESFFATLECELLARTTLSTHAEARAAVFEFVEGWYNTRRRHSALGYASPLEFERLHAAGPVDGARSVDAFRAPTSLLEPGTPAPTRVVTGVLLETHGGGMMTHRRTARLRLRKPDSCCETCRLVEETNAGLLGRRASLGPAGCRNARRITGLRRVSPRGAVEVPGLWTPGQRRAEFEGRRGGRPQPVGNLAGAALLCRGVFALFMGLFARGCVSPVLLSGGQQPSQRVPASFRRPAEPRNGTEHRRSVPLGRAPFWTFARRSGTVPWEWRQTCDGCDDRIPGTYIRRAANRRPLHRSPEPSPVRSGRCCLRGCQSLPLVQRSPADERERTRTGTAPAAPGFGTQAPARTSRPTQPERGCWSGRGHQRCRVLGAARARKPRRNDLRHDAGCGSGLRAARSRRLASARCRAEPAAGALLGRDAPPRDHRDRLAGTTAYALEATVVLDIIHTWQRRRGVRCSSSAHRRACRHLVRDPMGVDRRTVTLGCSCGGSQLPQAAGALMRTETSHEAREDQRKSPIGR